MELGARREVVMSLVARVVGGLEKTSLLEGQETWHAFCGEVFHLTKNFVSFYDKRDVS